LGLVHLRSIYTPAGTGLSFSVVELDDDISCPVPWSDECNKATTTTTANHPSQEQLTAHAHEPLAPAFHQPSPYTTATTQAGADPIMMEKVAIMDRPVEIISREEPSLMELSIDPESLGDVVLDDWPELELFDVDFDLMCGWERPAARVPFEQLVTGY